MFEVTVKGGTLPQEEIDAYIFYTKKKYGTILPEHLEMILELDGDYVNISYNPPLSFHAYRSTDYLVNDVHKLNPSKYDEFLDKVAHAVE
ncbi:MAG: hypothetical protein K2H89_11690 [Oscillospiraceae bacterium]|nr:hypothetical protein [Oscillospiraceae bacterium]